MPDQEPDVVVDPTEEEIIDQPSDVVVDLAAPKKDEKPVKDTPKPEATKPPVDLSKLHNTIAYQNRKLEQAMRELQEVRQQLASRPTVQESVKPQNLDEIDEIAQKDWKLGVKKVVEKDIEAKVQEILSKREQAILEVQKRVEAESELDKSRQKVLAKYPEIEDDQSETSQLYRQIINEDKSILKNLHGPEIVMYRMEERMRQMGKVPPSIQPVVDREVNRLARAGVSSVVGRQASPSGKITLTKEQKEFCDHYKIPYEQYAKNLKAQEAIGGVEA